jgi:hypothetical protein
LKEKARDRTQWRSRFGRGYGPVVRQTTEWMNEWTMLLYILKLHFIAFKTINFWYFLIDPHIL